MRKTNQQKWAELNEILDAKKEIIINSIFPKSKPVSVYTAYWNGITEDQINSFSVKGSKEPYIYSGKKITGKDVDALKSYIDKFDSDNKRVFIYYGGETYIGAYKLEDITLKNHRSFNREELLDIHKELQEKYGPREGYKNCQYCGLQVPEDTLVKGTIFSRGKNPRIGLYCSSRCASYDQMAQEG